MRQLRKNFRATVQVTSGLRPIVLHMGLTSFESTVAEATKFAGDLIDSIGEAKSQAATDAD
jgi:hypothetical protein